MNEVAPDSAAPAVSQASMRTPTERLQDFAAAVRRRWLPALLVFTLTAAGAAVLTSAGPKSYDATAQILLQPTDAVESTISPGTVSSEADAQRDVTTYSQEITVEPVARAVRSLLRLDTTLPSLVERISVSGQETSNLVSITARDSRPALAAALASAFATEYQRYRKQLALSQIDQALAAAEADPQAKVKGSPVAARVELLQAAAASETGGVQIIRPATVPSSAASPNLRKSILLGIVAGLILALAAVFAMEFLDRRLVDPRQLEAAFGVPALAIIPGGRRLHDAARLQAARRQPYTDLAARLAFTSLAAGSRTIMISPASRRESSDRVALGLAQALGMLGRRVILIEADICAQGTSAPESDEPSGLTAVLAGRSSFERELNDVFFVAGSGGEGHEVEPWALVSYSTLPCGPPVAEPEALLGREAMRDVIERAQAHADLVLVATAPLDRPSGVLPLVRLCAGVIIVAHERAIRAEQAHRIAELLRSAPASLLGTVLVRGGSAKQQPARSESFAGLVPRARRASANGNRRDLHPRAAAGPHEDQGV